jgi:biopolymer transport protein ExbB
VNTQFLPSLSYDLLHTLTFDALYACLVILTFVVIERLLYFTYLNLRERKVAVAMRQVSFDPGDFFAHNAARDVITRSLGEYAKIPKDGARSELEDISSALFLHLDAKVNARLWILDTIVTAAPLLGLLGTILGIMQTFNALSQGGISDPSAVSRGIGTALIATALGIGTALYGLVTHNMLHRYAEYLTTNFKDFLLRI